MMPRSQALLGGLRISTVVNLPWSSTCDMTLVPLDDVPGVASDFPSTSTSTPAADSLPAGIADLPPPLSFPLHLFPLSCSPLLSPLLCPSDDCEPPQWWRPGWVGWVRWGGWWTGWGRGVVCRSLDCRCCVFIICSSRSLKCVCKCSTYIAIWWP